MAELRCNEQAPRMGGYFPAQQQPCERRATPGWKTAGRADYNREDHSSTSTMPRPLPRSSRG
eukprot:5650195-Prorocentrum_lima.AAC.1